MTRKLRQPGRREFRLLGHANRGRAQRCQQQRPHPTHLRRKAMRNPPVPRQHPHRGRRMQRSKPDKDRRRNRTGRSDQRHRRNGVVGTKRKLADQIPRFRPQRCPYREHQSSNRVSPIRRDRQPTQSRNPDPKRHVLGAQREFLPAARFSLESVREPTVSRPANRSTIVNSFTSAARAETEDTHSRPHATTAPRPQRVNGRLGDSRHACRVGRPACPSTATAPGQNRRVLRLAPDVTKPALTHWGRDGLLLPLTGRWSLARDQLKVNVECTS